MQAKNWGKRAWDMNFVRNVTGRENLPVVSEQNCKILY